MDTENLPPLAAELDAELGAELANGSTLQRPPGGTWDLLVDPLKHPGWISGSVRLPATGERVYSAEGAGVVVRIVGKTGTAGHLLELSMEDGRKAPYFAAAANVLVRP